MAVVTQIQLRRDTAANWTSTNPTLASGEMGFETDTGKAKIGNGSSTWTALSYAVTGAAGTVTSVVGGTGLTGGTITSTGTLAIDTSVVVDKTTTQTLTNKTLTAPVITYSVNAQTGTTYTPVLSDAAAVITLTNASSIAVTIPPNSSVAYAVGTQINFIQGGAGQVTISGGSGVTIASTGGTSTAPKIRAQNAMATAIQTAANTWYVVGDIA